MKCRLYRGQTVLIVILVLAVALTVALSFVRRTTTDIARTGQTEDAARAFNAAEAGIEDVMKRAQSSTATIQSGDGSASYETTYMAIGGSSSTYAYPAATDQGDAATVWLAAHDADGDLVETGQQNYCPTGVPCTLQLCWDTPAASATSSAVEIEVFYKNNSAYALTRTTSDPSPTRIGNKFDPLPRPSAAPLQDACGNVGVYAATVTLPTNTGTVVPLILRLRPYYGQTTFFISPQSGQTLPPQGFEVSSVGKTDSGTSRKIVVKKMYDAPPTVLDFVLYANQDISTESY